MITFTHREPEQMTYSKSVTLDKKERVPEMLGGLMGLLLSLMISVLSQRPKS